VKTILDKDENASVVVGGDCNEFLQTRSVYAAFDGILTDADEVANIAPLERYTYVFDQNNQQLDHIFVSDAVAERTVAVEHIHVNNWSPLLSQRISDHDPSVAKFKIC
jgi:predicted extracellular nuclease